MWEGVSVGGRTIHCLRFTDEMMIFSDETVILQTMIQKLQGSKKEYRMKVNNRKQILWGLMAEKLQESA